MIEQDDNDKPDRKEWPYVKVENLQQRSTTNNSIELALATYHLMKIGEDIPVDNGELAQAAAGYALNAAPGNITTSLVKIGEITPWYWPVGWKSNLWSPSHTDRKQEIAKSIGLLLNELDRLFYADEQQRIGREAAGGTVSQQSSQSANGGSDL